MDATFHHTVTVTLTLTEREARHLFHLLEIAKREITFPANGELGPFLDLLQSSLGNPREMTLAPVAANGKD